MRDDVRGVEISPVTSADTVYVSDRRLPNIIGNLSSLQTTDKSNLVNAINEVAQGGGGSEWELLVEHTTTEVTRDVRLSLPRSCEHIRILCQGLASGNVYFGTNAAIENGYTGASSHIFVDISTSETFGELATFHPLSIVASGAFIKEHLISPSDANFQAIFNAVRVYSTADIPIGTKIRVYGI